MGLNLQIMLEDPSKLTEAHIFEQPRDPKVP
jgi:hypothetical protein